MSDLYAVLGISRLAERDEVARAYRRSALTLNPACAPAASLAVSGNSATELDARKAELYRRFRLVGQAYTVLSDPKYRGIYDAYGEDGCRHGGTAGTAPPLDLDAIDPDVVFRKFFGVDDPFHVAVEAQGINGQAHAFFSEDAVRIKNPPPTDELVVELPVTLEEAYAGATKNVAYESQHLDLKGKPSGKPTEKQLVFAVPLGVEDGASFVFKGIGHTGEQRSPGPLRVVVRISEHPVYRREGLDLVVTASISLCQALTGVSIVVPTIDKRELTVSVDEVACHKYRARLKGEGLPSSSGAGTSAAAKRGDLVVEIIPVFPAYLSAEQKRELKRVLSEDS
jgi:DnaJ-class molecular chaperone